MPHQPTRARLETVHASYLLSTRWIATATFSDGIRTPAVDAPVAITQRAGTDGCGRAVLLPVRHHCASAGPAHIAVPNHGRFVLAWSRATVDAVRDVFVLANDGLNILIVGAQSDILK